MGKRSDESAKRQATRREQRSVFAAPVVVQNPVQTLEYEEAPPIKNMTTCGNEKCCKAYAFPETMDGRAFPWPQKMIASIPMPCAGEQWVPKAKSKRSRETFAPGLSQFTKK